ncbi:hypothetical protein GIB67_016906 [Kingdonia uniflora]|uniref:Uncharacterized protein n=1 Tax=Kingdonia uniflora TaxID=39325 RepID=A0A7J7M3K8_9MAGN|nr:hypothetical protein GIB67_016906 [Kingdonia uniflora]
MNKASIEAKFELYKSHGWYELDIIFAFRKFPGILEYSDQNIRATMSFLINEVGYKPKDIACIKAIVLKLQFGEAKAIQNDRKLDLNGIGVLHRADIGVYLRMKDDLRSGFGKFCFNFALFYKWVYGDLGFAAFEMIQALDDVSFISLKIIVADAEINETTVAEKKERKPPQNRARLGFDSSQSKDSEEAEALSVIRGMEAAHMIGIERALVLTDCRRIVRAYETRSKDLSWGALAVAPDAYFIIQLFGV